MDFDDVKFAALSVHYSIRVFSFSKTKLPLLITIYDNIEIQDRPISLSKTMTLFSKT